MENDFFEDVAGTLSGNVSENNGHGNNKDIARESTESDSVQVLQLTDSFFVADTVEDDDSFMIPATPDVIIPSTQEFTSEEKDTQPLSIDETCTLELGNESRNPHNVFTMNDNEEDILNDMTQDLPGLDEVETQPLLPKEKQVTQENTKAVQEEDDWELRFSETQETQELLSTAKMKEAQEQEKLFAASNESCLKDTSLIEPNLQQLNISLSQKKSGSPVKCLDKSSEKDSDSEDEIEPSQSCLLDYQTSSTYSALREEQIQSSLNAQSSAKAQENKISETYDKPHIDSNYDVILIPDSPPAVSTTTTSLLTTNTKDDQKEQSVPTIDIGDDTGDKRTNIDSDIVELTSSGKVVEEPLLTKIDTWICGDKSKISETTPLKEDKHKSPTSNVVSSNTTTQSNRVNEVEMIDISESKDVTLSDLGDPKDTTISDLGDAMDTTESDLGNPKDTTLSDLINPQEFFTSDLAPASDPAVSNSVQPYQEELEEKLPDHGEVKDTLVSDVIDQKDLSAANNDSEKNSIKKDSGLQDTNLAEKIIQVSTSQSKEIKKLSFECASEGEEKINASTPHEDRKSDQCGTSEGQEVEGVNLTPIVKSKKEEESAPFSVKPILQHGIRLSRQKQKVQFQNEKEIDKPQKMVGSFKDSKSLGKIFKTYKIDLQQQYSEAILNLKPKEEIKLTKVYSFLVKDNKVYLEESSQLEHPSLVKHETSPHSSSGSGSLTTTTSSSISNSASYHSGEGELADIDTSSSAKSNSSAAQDNSTILSLPSQDPMKTSTQNSEQPSSFSDFFDPKKEEKEIKEPTSSKATISPIKSVKSQKKAPPRGRKRTCKESSSPSSSGVDRRKKGKFCKETDSADTKSENETACLTTEEIKASKVTRSRRRTVANKPEKEQSTKPEVKEIDPDNEVTDGSAVGNFLPGLRVMARWTDGFYYPGVILGLAKEDRWSVVFDDGTVKAINQEGLIKASLIQPGTSILVQNADSFFDSGIVRGLYREGDDVGYEIELDNGITKRYPRKSVVLSTDQAKLILKSRPPTTPATMTINLDNIVDGKRRRKSLLTPEHTMPVKKSARVTRKAATKVDSHVDTSADSTIESVNASSAEKDAGEEEGAKSSSRPSRKRKAAVTANKKAKLLIQKKHPKLFKDYAFLLTNTERKLVPKIETASDSESFTEEENIKPFDKEELVILIMTRGGTVLDKFDDIKKCNKDHIYLLANTYLRTMKYIQCLASAIPCIKHHWVQNCCNMEQILDIKNFVLPAGMSIISNEIIEWHGKSDVLKGKKISLVSAPGNNFVDNWTPVLLAAKVDFVQKSLPTSKSGACAYVDLIITNSACPQDIIQVAKRRKIPVVSIEWVIQSLIRGKCLPYDAHPKFKHNFTE